MKYYWENGFYTEQNQQNSRYEITEEYWEELLEAQSKGKEIKTDINGKPIAVDHIITEQEQAQMEMLDLENWFNEYDLQTIQYARATRLGETFDKDINMLDNEARAKASRIKELRAILEG